MYKSRTTFTRDMVCKLCFSRVDEKKIFSEIA